LAVPEKNLAALQAICDEEGVELANLGRFGTPDDELVLRYRGEEVGRLAMNFLHDGLPKLEREATWVAPRVARRSAAGGVPPRSPGGETEDGARTTQAPRDGGGTQSPARIIES